MKRSQVQASSTAGGRRRAQRTKADVRLGTPRFTRRIDGVVDVRAARAGEVVNPGQPV